MKSRVKVLVLVGVAAVLVGCVSQGERARREALASKAKDAYFESLSNARVKCLNKAECDKAFSLAKLYVNQSSDMKVQMSDDTMISTYNPIDYGYIGMSATKTPGAGESATISLTAHCKGFDVTTNVMSYYEGFGFSGVCVKRLTRINNEFKGYVQPGV